MQRNKGNRIEREIVSALNAIDGIEARRIPLSGAVRGFEGDIRIRKRLPEPGDVGRNYLAEVKGRANGQGFKLLERWLEGNHLLFLRRDRQKPLVVMQWDEFEELLK